MDADFSREGGIPLKFSERVFENTPLIKNRKSFWVPPFDRKRQRLLKLFGKSFTKNFCNFSMLSRLTFQTISGFSAISPAGHL
ncbi:hypothetical protein [Novacetimonas hansenii]|uniref:hypothetical protein n=1 Tax=Novacetimonas hansenii TaxID=436 RepID=UPI000AE58AA1|nr:hypothetical protein [Novacetimonas hansenii]